MTSLPPDYPHRVYAGVLGKLIGVYLGRPFEQWTHQRIVRELGPITGYQHEKLGVPLIVTDDDISGTFTFVRALMDHNAQAGINSGQIGQTWLNYIAENRHILWWGGMGLSTEHTAYLRLAGGIEAPRSGSIQRNGRPVAEEIGAQIFIDGWALVAPNQPDLAARLAAEAARVSHDGVAVHAAQVIAVMESLAFVESDIDRLLDAALERIPRDSELAEMNRRIRKWCRQDADWTTTLQRIQAEYGYDRYGTNGPVMSNHALIIMALLHGGGDFDRSMMIVSTSGWDTDCNAGNLGCLLGIRNGLEGLTRGYDWRSPVNDRAYVAAADGHRGVTDATTLAMELINIGRGLAGLDPLRPKNGSLFHFVLPGSTHGFAPAEGSAGTVGISALNGEPGGLEIRLLQNRGAIVQTSVFLPPSSFQPSTYSHVATPRVYPGQTLTADVQAVGDNTQALRIALHLSAYGADDAMQHAQSPWVSLVPGQSRRLQWVVPSMGHWPIQAIGLALEGHTGDRCILHWMDVTGVPSLRFDPPSSRQGPYRSAWERSWCGSMHHFYVGPAFGSQGPFDLIHNRGRGLLHTGSAHWRDYSLHAQVCPWLAEEFGLAVRVRGLTRYYALLMSRDELRLIRMNHDQVILARTSCTWQPGQPLTLHLQANGTLIRGGLIGGPTLQAHDECISAGGIGLIVAEGRCVFGGVVINP